MDVHNDSRGLTDEPGSTAGSGRHRDTSTEASTSQASLARVIAQFPGAAAVYAGPQHVVRAVSAAYRAIIGGREVVGLPIREALPDLDGQGFFELLDRAYTTGNPVVVTGVTARWDADGDGQIEERTIDFRYQPLVADDGRVEGVVAFIQDVTARDAAQAALAASEARLRLAIDASQLGTWTWDPSTDTTTFDARVRDLFGFEDVPPTLSLSRAAILAPRVHPDDRDGVAAALAAAADPAGDGRYHAEFRIVRPDGSERWALALGRMQFAGDGPGRRGTSLVGTVLDVTDRKRAEVRDRVLARLGGELLTVSDVDATLQRLADVAVTELADWAIVDVIAPDRRTARRAAMAHADPAKVALLHELAARYPPNPAHPPLGRDVLATGRAQLYTAVDEALVRSIAPDAEQARLTRSIGARSAMVVPLQTRDGPIGVAAFGSGRRAFTHDDLLIAQELGRRASLTIVNARLVADAERARRDAERAAMRTSRLQTLSAALASALTPNDVARTAVRESVAATGADAGLLVLLTPDGTALDVVEFRGYDPDQVERWRRFPLDATTPLAEAVRTGEPVFVATPTERDARFPELARRGTVRYPASISVPLMAEGRSLGALGVSFREAITAGPEDRALLLAVARQCAQAVRRATLFDAEGVARAAAEAAARDNARLYRESEAARRDAEAASRAKGQFLAVMSHELRTPLNAILGYSELLELGVHGAVSDAQRESLARIRRSGQHLLSLVNNVLNLERAETGALETEIVPVPVAELFENADALARVQAEAKGLTLTVVAPPPGATILGDRDKAGQVLANLLSNAVKFTPGGGRITLECELEAQRVRLRVRDTGVGIPPSALERVFAPFVQLDSGLTRRAEGAGLGLAISRSLARLMGGDLTAESTVGVGSTFTLTLPRAAP